MKTEKSNQELLKLLEEAEYRLEEATDTLEAIRSGQIDALIVKGDDGHSIYSLQTADHSFRIFIEQMSDGAVTLSRNGMIIYTNSSFANIVGLPLEKIVGNLFDQFILPKDQSIWNEINSNAWDNHIKIELQLLSADQTIIPVLLSLTKLELSDGIAMSIIVTDLSLQKKTERLLKEKNRQLEEAQRETKHLNANLENTVEERTKALQVNISEKIVIEQNLRSNQERLAQILETMAEGVVIFDLEGQLTYANPMAKKILGITQLDDEYIDPKWELLFVNGDPLPAEHYPIHKAISSGQPVYDYEVAVQPPEGDRFFISVNAAPIKDARGEIISGIGTFMDVTHRRKLIQQKDDFISVASHELRTPVTALKASLQMLDRIKDRGDAGLMTKMILQANKSMNKMSTLIEDLLNATKMNEGQLHLKKSWINLESLIRSCCDDTLSNTPFHVIIEGDLSLNVFADEQKIEQVIVNFISNAAKYAPLGKEIHISIHEHENMTKVAVIDNGPGISEDKLPHIFDRFYRVDSAGTQYSGLGLGLYICSEIIYKHGGQIGADSEVGQGSTFWFTLPSPA